MALLCLVAILTSACSSKRPVHRWNDRVIEVGALTDRGALAEAETKYLRLLDTAPGEEERRYVLVELARISEDQDEFREALERYARVRREDIDDEYGAEALYRSALIYEEHFDDGQKARDWKRRAILRYPRSVSAEFAVRELADHYSERGNLAQMQKDFRTLYKRVQGDPIGDNIMFELGRALERTETHDDEALEAYREVVRLYNDDSLADDALWQMARIYRRHQNWRPALKALTLCADKMEVSWFIGDYNSPWANDARFQLGIINLLFLDNYDRAIQHFEQYIDDFPASVYTDDAAWHIVEARRLAGNRGAYRDALRSFIEDFPESRHVRTAQTRLGISPEEVR